MEKKESSQPKKQSRIKKWFASKSKKSLILGSVFIVAIPIAAGVAVGIVYNKFFVGKTADYTNINTDELYTDTDKVMEKYTYCNENSLSYEETLKPYEFAIVSLELFAKEEYSKSVTVGLALAAVVTQTIRNCTIKNGNNFLEESISKSSLVGVATRTYMDQDGNINFYEGAPIDSENATWPEEPVNFTSEEYANIYGRTPSTPTPYIFSKKTVISSQSSVEKKDNNYVVTLSLNPTKAVVNYVKQMKNISHLADYPAFSFVDITITCSNNLMIETMSIHESYYAKTGAVGADIDCNSTVYYETGKQYDLPALSTPINYGEYSK